MSYRRTATIVGALYLICNITFLVGAAGFVEPTLSAPDYLSLIASNRTQVILGVLLELMNGVAYIGIAVLMFPILRKRFESLALAYVGFRFVEFVMQIASDLSPLALLNLSEAFAAAGAPEVSAFQTLGASLLADRYWAFQMISITFGLGGLLFYTMLYQLRLVPQFISIWGLIGAIFVLISAPATMFEIDASSLGILMLLNELFLGGWLIVRGFNQPQQNEGTA